MIEAGVELLIPFIMAAVLEKNDALFSMRMGAVMFAIVLCGSVLATLGQYCSAKAAAFVSERLRGDMYKKINSLEFADIDKLGAASLINRLTADVNALQNAVLFFVRIAIRAPFLIFGSIVFAMLIDRGIALIIVACLPFLIASFYFITRRLVPRYTKIQKTLDGITLETKENLEGVRVVRAFNKREQEVSEFKKYTEQYSDMSIGAGKMSAALGPLNTLIINIGVAAIVFFVARAVQAERFDAANISAFVSYMIQIVTALNMVTHLTLSFVKASASNKRVKELFDVQSGTEREGGYGGGTEIFGAPPLKKNESGGENGTEFYNIEVSGNVSGPKNIDISDNGTEFHNIDVLGNVSGFKNLDLSDNATGFKNIDLSDNVSVFKNIDVSDNILEFKSVNFGYDKNGLVLQNISFSLKRGETLGIIGGTGSGKTTLINLIPRFYEVLGGGIFYNGTNIRGIPREILRREIAVVAQEAAVFSGTVKDNIRFGTDLTDEEIISAATLAQAREFIEKLPLGYDSPTEQSGRNLSGGQKQRISIARGIARKGRILILDDSSSALDYLTESKLRAALARMTDTTKIIVSQRTSSVAAADKILVLDKGKLVGSGKHEELLKECKIYAKIYESQNL
ncbi:MAG: ABC transporter ATP-binding protein/permease [Clostridiales bacterium]|nr:ABC transporter ATP-binding protein/permease [Clostridiales bacterium]